MSSLNPASMKIFRKNRKVYYFEIKKAFHGSFVATSLEMYSRRSALQCRGRTSGIRLCLSFLHRGQMSLSAIPLRCKLNWVGSMFCTILYWNITSLTSCNFKRWLVYFVKCCFGKAMAQNFFSGRLVAQMYLLTDCRVDGTSRKVFHGVFFSVGMILRCYRFFPKRWNGISNKP